VTNKNFYFIFSNMCLYISWKFHLYSTESTVYSILIDHCFSPIYKLNIRAQVLLHSNQAYMNQIQFQIVQCATM